MGGSGREPEGHAQSPVTVVEEECALKPQELLRYGVVRTSGLEERRRLFYPVTKVRRDLHP